MNDQELLEQGGYICCQFKPPSRSEIFHAGRISAMVYLQVIFGIKVAQFDPAQELAESDETIAVGIA